MNRYCDDCGRLVMDSHTCDGDPRSTCAIYGCGLPITESRLVETHGDGRMANLGRCAKHPYDEVAAEETGGAA